jgi:hypothetical protein
MFLLQKAAAGMIGAFLGRAAADIAINDAFPGNGMGN